MNKEYFSEISPEKLKQAREEADQCLKELRARNERIVRETKSAQGERETKVAVFCVAGIGMTGVPGPYAEFLDEQEAKDFLWDLAQFSSFVTVRIKAR